MMELNINNCQNCNSQTVHLFSAKDENRRISNDTFYYALCKHCGLITLQNVPHDLGRYYGSDYYNIPTLTNLKKLALRENAKLDAILPYTSGRNLLEIGSAFGVFALRAKLDGFEVESIERDPRCCEYLRETVGISVYQNVEPHLAIRSLKQHDVIALWHVIEHLEHPFDFFDAAISNLKHGGLLVLGTPNPESRQFRLMGAAWPHLDAPRHVHLIPASVLIERAKRQGLEVCRLTSNDSDAKSWNRFGWQRLLMNRLPGRVLQMTGFAIGAGISAAAAPFETSKFNGSSYTLTLRKA